MRSAISPLALLALVVCALSGYRASARKSTRRIRSSKRLNATTGAATVAGAATTTTLSTWTTVGGQKCELRRICEPTEDTLPTDKNKPKDFKNKGDEKNDGNGSLTTGGGAHYDIGAKAEHIIIPGELDKCYTLVFPPACPPKPGKKEPEGCLAITTQKECTMASIAPHGCLWFEALAKIHDSNSQRQNYIGEQVLQADGVSRVEFIELAGDDDKKEEGSEESAEEGPGSVNGVVVDEPEEGQALDQEYVKEGKIHEHKAYCTAKTGVKHDYLALVQGLGVPEAEHQIMDMKNAVRDNAG